MSFCGCWQFQQSRSLNELNIGKNIVGAVLEGGGFEVIDLGAGVTPEKFTLNSAS